MREFGIFAAVVLMGIGVGALGAEPPQIAATKDNSKVTAATYLITSLHCPPCTRTVESSLGKVQGIRSIRVDWNSKNAKIEFDESVIPAQTVAQRIASTPHMMGSGMHYEGWLALKVPDLKDEASAKKVKEALGKVEGVKTVVSYPDRHAIGVQFKAEGTITTATLIDALSQVGFKAANM